METHIKTKKDTIQVRKMNGGPCKHGEVGGKKLTDKDFDENMNLKSGKSWNEYFDDFYGDDIDKANKSIEATKKIAERNDIDNKVKEMIKAGKENYEIKLYLESLDEEDFDWYEADNYIDYIRSELD